MIQLREEKVGQYTVRELPMRETMRILGSYPDGSDKAERGAAMLGAAVTNGSGEPMGLTVLDIGTSTYRALMAAFERVSEAPALDGDPGNV